MTNRDKSRTVAIVVLFGALVTCWGQLLLTRPPAAPVKRGPRVLTLSENGHTLVFVDGKEYVEKDRVIEPREVWCGRGLAETSSPKPLAETSSRRGLEYTK